MNELALGCPLVAVFNVKPVIHSGTRIPLFLVYIHIFLQTMQVVVRIMLMPVCAMPCQLIDYCYRLYTCSGQYNRICCWHHHHYPQHHDWPVR